MISVAIIALLASSSAVFAAPVVSISLAGKNSVTNVDNFKVAAKVTNSGDETLTLLNDPATLLTPNWNTNTFRITSAKGVIPEFKGVAVKWSPTAAVKSKSFTIIEPGQTVEFEHSLGGVYDFTAPGASTYTILPTRRAATFTHVTISGKLVSLRANIAAGHSIALEGKLVPTKNLNRGAKRRFSPNKREHSFVSCSSHQQSDLEAAAVGAQTYADLAYTYLDGIFDSTPRYNTWFGAYDSSRKQTVQTHFDNIRDGQLDSDTFDCTCTDPNTFAYVYPDTFGYIYLCGAFWNAPMTGTDSKAGTLVHESSHFTANGGTKDYAYGQPNCEALANDDPDRAIMNADSHEYFAENNPPLA